ncbi:uncharacterized protein B0H18DRAFT_995798 [Fomitopsis serialis]|uniref:uncharacterized protein n=1 Tax=Fomitopsis serialis TaxID=139415 RepID=UPI0020079BEC|nr:uncharacterized protein B0H18DRAFT_995798 [Neoantrodia serialis]KAH9929697.1 hypothetical protein B0H18DRAFT_995798 [Neoantrodia serialis]
MLDAHPTDALTQEQPTWEGNVVPFLCKAHWGNALESCTDSLHNAIPTRGVPIQISDGMILQVVRTDASRNFCAKSFRFERTFISGGFERQFTVSPFKWVAKGMPDSEERQVGAPRERSGLLCQRRRRRIQVRAQADTTMLPRLYRGFASLFSPPSDPRKIMAAKDLVEIAIFSKSYCPYCRRAKTLLTSKFPNTETKIYELDEMNEGSEIQEYLLERQARKLSPTSSSKHVGGCDAVVGLDSKGQLAGLVGA